MKIVKFWMLLAILWLGCVQKSSKKTVIVRLNVENVKDIQTVGIRGEEKPLTWRSDLALKPLKKDTLYETAFSLVTGYKFTEAKFTVNGQVELKNKANRRILLNERDTTIFEATFDVEK